MVDDGEAGKGAYEQWVEEVKTGMIDDPHNPGRKWPADYFPYPDHPWDGQDQYRFDPIPVAYDPDPYVAP